MSKLVFKITPEAEAKMSDPSVKEAAKNVFALANQLLSGGYAVVKAVDEAGREESLRIGGGAPNSRGTPAKSEATPDHAGQKGWDDRTADRLDGLEKLVRQLIGAVGGDVDSIFRQMGIPGGGSSTQPRPGLQGQPDPVGTPFLDIDQHKPDGSRQRGRAFTTDDETEGEGDAGKPVYSMGEDRRIVRALASELLREVGSDVGERGPGGSPASAEANHKVVKNFVRSFFGRER